MGQKTDEIRPDPPPREDIAVGSLQKATNEEENNLHKALKDRHLSMIAIGGALGTGLLVGTGVLTNMDGETLGSRLAN